MKIVELYYEKLVSTDNYSNVRFGARATFSPASEERELVEEKLKDYVDTQLAKLIEDKRESAIEQCRRSEIDRLDAMIRDRDTELRKLNEWMLEHREFVLAVEHLTGKTIELPF